MKWNRTIRDRMIIGCLILAIVMILGASATIAWYTDSGQNDVSNIKMGGSTTYFEIKTSGSTGIYDSYFSEADNEYSDNTETGGTTSKIKWRLTKGNTEETLTQGNMNNLYLEEGEPDGDDMAEIKRQDSSDYGLSPGDYGTLKFTIVPKKGNIDTTIKLFMTCYKTEYYTTGDKIGYQKDVFTKMNENVEADADAIKFISSHITFYYEGNDGNRHLITRDGFNESNISTNREVTIYWVWPEKLRNILELNVTGLDTTAAQELRAYLLKNPDLFLTKNIEDGNSIFDSIKVSENATESDIQAKATAMLATTATYTYWGARYNNADQTIGDDVGYIMVEASVELND